ncbi:MAG: murein biosynthesis integral membrane protein MurJ [bacterium]|nr:murein biosynthesis integral membrane protein MurJ [bacterium]
MKEYEIDFLNQRDLLKPTLLITFFSILSIIISFFTQVILAAKFGAKIEMDSYLVAIVIPEFITAVLITALNVTFIPIFIEYETQKNKDEAWKVASITINFIFVTLFLISFLGCIFAPKLVSVAAPGFNGKSFLLTVSLIRIVLPSIIFSGLGNLLSSLYYARHQFFKPAIAPIINGITILLLVITLHPLWGIRSVAFGNLVGSIVSFLILTPILLKRYIFNFDFLNKGMLKVVRVMSPLVFAGLFSRATTLIERIIASNLAEGSISYLGYSSKIINILGTIATSGIAITIFPLMARSWAENDLARVREHFAKGVRIIMLTTFPIAAIFAVLRVPIIQLLLERGKFDYTATVAVTNVLLIHLIAFITAGLGNVVGKGFYISQKTKLAAFLAVIETSIYLCISYILSKYLSYIGLAIATSIYYTLGLIISMFVMEKIYEGINGKQVFNGFIKILAASLFSAIGMHYCSNLVLLKNALILRSSISGILGIMLYVTFVIYIFKIEEAFTLKEKIIGRFKKVFS